MSETENSGNTIEPESLNSSSNTNSTSSTGSTSSSSSSNTNSSSSSNTNSSSSENNTPPPPPKKSAKKNQSAKKNKGKSAAKSAKKNNTTQKNKPKKKVRIVEGVNKTAALQARRAQALKNLTAAIGKSARVGNAATLTSLRNKGASEEEISAFIEKVRTGQTFKTGKKAENKGKSSKKNKNKGKSSKKNKNQGKSSKKNKSVKKNKKAKNLLKTQVPANNATTKAPTTAAAPSDKFKALMERRAKALANLSARFEGTGVKAKVGNAASLTALRNKGATEEEQEEFIQRALRGETMKKTGRRVLTAVQEANEDAPTATSVKNALTQAANAAKVVQTQFKEAKKTSKKVTAAIQKEQKAVENLAKKEADRVAKEEKARRLVDLERQASENLRGATGKNAKKVNTRKLAALRNSGLDFSVQEYLKMKAALRTLKNRGFRNGSGIVEGPGGKKFICENCKPMGTTTGQNVTTQTTTPTNTTTSANVLAASAQTNPLANNQVAPTTTTTTTSDELIESLDE